jgi:tripeptide aminopeptidase
LCICPGRGRVRGDKIKGEARSHDPRFVREITAAYRNAFRGAANAVHDQRGGCAKVRFRSRLDYYPFRIRDTAPVVRQALAAAEAAGFQPALRVTNGGLDANWLVRHGIPTITFGAGQNNVHTIDEFVDVKEFARGCRLALALATLENGS